ncbi:MAG: PTS glucose transporter subunit IIA [Anaerolineales bacterium]
MGKKIEILSPFSGRVRPLGEVPDQVFARRMMGEGLAVEPTGDLATAPIAGSLDVFHSAGHAFSVKGRVDEEVAVLVHIGIDTVEMKGEGFERFAEEGDEVEAGQKLARFDLEVIREAEYATISPVTLPDLPEGYEVEKTSAESVEAGKDVLLTVVPPE